MMRSPAYLMMALALVVGCGDETIHDTVVKVSGQHSLEVGNTLALSAETLNGTDASYTWSSGDTTIATVDANGVVTAMSVGETSITATGDSTKVAGAHALVVVGAGSVQVVVSGQHAVEVGKTLALSASTQNGTDGSYIWSSSDATVASVDTAGQVTGVAVGEVTISAKGGDTGTTGQHTVVVVPVGSAMVEITGTLSVLVHKTSKLTATTKGGSDTGYTWASDKPEVATVGADGTVTGISNGQVIIIAQGKDSGAKGSIGLVVTDEVPNYDKWLTSGHADRKAEAFNHWNADTPAEVPTSCAKCHSTPGFRDFIGEDGSAVDVVDKAAAIGTVVECTACHNKAADALSHVVFPSGVKLENLGPESRCMTCHQGRESTDSVEKAITTAAPATDDTVSTGLSFKNVHYYAAAATLNAGRVRGGYQYTGKTYDYRFRHANKVDTCVDCHDAHTLQVKLDDCKMCHAGVTTTADLKQIRMIDSSPDYNGNGNTTEGIYDEMIGMRALLLKALQGYVTDQSLSKICYNGGTYPYWFKDTDGDGTCSATEAVSANGFSQWTARLLRGA